MINANDAHRISEENKVHAEDSKLLLNHLEQLIRKASANGKFLLEKITFADDRFKQSVIDEVVSTLTENGFKVTVDKHNAMHQIIINVSW